MRYVNGKKIWGFNTEAKFVKEGIALSSVIQLQGLVALKCNNAMKIKNKY